MLVGDGCSNQALRWTESAEHLAFIMRSTSKSDKARAHSYEYLYHRQLGPIAHRACDCLKNNSNNQRARGARAARSTSECKPIRFLEIGLGCGMPWGAGASVEMWHNLFRPPLKLELHILELDRPCSEKWTSAHRTRATVHVGSQSSPADLDRLYNASGASPFDVVADDGSHRPQDQLVTLQHALERRRVAPGGVYIVEDIMDSCLSWRGPSCFLDRYGNATLFAKVVDWQRDMSQGFVPLPGVRSINFFQEGVAFEVYANSDLGATRRADSPPLEEIRRQHLRAQRVPLPPLLARLRGATTPWGYNSREARSSPGRRV
jgi:hypothetical protein